MTAKTNSFFGKNVEFVYLFIITPQNKGKKSNQIVFCFFPPEVYCFKQLETMNEVRLTETGVISEIKEPASFIYLPLYSLFLSPLGNTV